MAAPAKLPPGPRYPPLIQAVGYWTRPLAFMEHCRERYGPRFTIRLPASPPFVMLTRPEDVKKIFTAPPDVLAPGRGARVLEPVVGSTSVILLDGDAHMEQRRLMLPAFHGERMERLAGLVQAVAEREVASWPWERPVELHPRMQRLALEIILRAVFGLEPGPRLDALRARLGQMLAFGDKPISLLPLPIDSRRARLLVRVGPFASFWRQRQDADELIFEQIEERRREQREDPQGHVDRDDVLAMLLEARHEDGSSMSADRRRCLGASFALLEMKIVLQAVLGARELRPVADRPEPPRRRNITIRPARGGTSWLVPRSEAAFNGTEHESPRALVTAIAGEDN